MSPEPVRPMDPDSSGRLPLGILVLLSLLLAGAPLVVDSVLPALPRIEAEFEVSTTAAQSVIAAVLLGLGIGQVTAGVVSDLLGRRPVLLAGLTIGLGASVGAAFAGDLRVLVLLRFVQGVGVAAGVVIARAMVADVSTGLVAARNLATVQSWATVVPVAAPMVGGLLVMLAGWRGLLGAVALAVGLGLLLSAWRAPETLPRERRSATARRTQRAAILQGVRSGRFPLLLLAHSANFTVLMAYVTASPFLYREILGMNAVQYGAAAAALMALVGIGGLVAARLLRHIGVHQLLVRGIAGVAASSTITLLLALSPVPRWTILLSAAAGLFAFGTIVGSIGALAVDTVRAGAGMGSALLGGAQFAVSGLIAPLSGVGGSTDPVPFAVIQVAGSTVLVLAYAAAHRLGARRGT